MSVLNLVVDFSLLILLGAALVVGFRLSEGLRDFKNKRAELEEMTRHLQTQIKRAEDAAVQMQLQARSTGANLQESIKETGFLVDELKFMNESGDSLADRLEVLAERNRLLVEKMENIGGIGANYVGGVKAGGRLPAVEERRAPSPIRARHMDDDENQPYAPSGGLTEEEERSSLSSARKSLWGEEGDSDFSGGRLESQAEKDLFEAVTQRSRQTGAGASAGLAPSAPLRATRRGG